LGIRRYTTFIRKLQKTIIFSVNENNEKTKMCAYDYTEIKKPIKNFEKALKEVLKNLEKLWGKLYEDYEKIFWEIRSMARNQTKCKSYFFRTVGKKYLEVWKTMKETLENYQKLLGKPNKNCAEIMRNYAEQYKATKNYTESMQEF